MYKLKPISYEPILREYYEKYSPIVLNLFSEYLNGKETRPRSIGKRGHKCITKAAVEQDPDKKSFTREFLTKYSQEANLRKLLCGSVVELNNIMQEILTDSPAHFDTLTKKKYPQQFKKASSLTIDDFHEIITEIFVKVLYDTELDKDDFIKNLNLRVCPYCGDTYIYETEKSNAGKVSVAKPQIDHFLPKSVYPFFAMSFMNLIPSCPTCNMAPNKHTLDPKGDDKTHEFLMQPYDFDENKLEFGYTFDGVDIYDNDAFEVLIDYKGNKDLEIGLKEKMTIHNRYIKHNPEVAQLWVRLSEYVEMTRTLFKDLELPDDFWKGKERPILGYSYSLENSREYIMYKFNKDILTKMLQDTRKERK